MWLFCNNCFNFCNVIRVWVWFVWQSNVNFSISNDRNYLKLFRLYSKKKQIKKSKYKSENLPGPWFPFSRQKNHWLHHCPQTQKNTVFLRFMVLMGSHGAREWQKFLPNPFFIDSNPKRAFLPNFTFLSFLLKKLEPGSKNNGFVVRVLFFASFSKIRFCG